MNRTITLLAVLLSLHAITYSQDFKNESKNLVSRMIKGLMEQEGIPPGISVAIGFNNEVVFSEGYGYTSLETKKPVTAKTQFRAASVSKIITVTALAKLIEDEKLNFNDSVQNHLSAYPKKEYPITIKQLTGHLSGMPHYSEGDKIEWRHYDSVEDGLSVFSHLPLLHQPGEKYQYSTHAFTLLSAVMEKGANQDFLQLLSDKLLGPLDMFSTCADIRNNPPQEMTELFDFYDNGANKGLPTKIINAEDPSYKWAGGGLISTPSDLVKMANSYLNGFIRKDIVDVMFESQHLNSGEATGVGVGWRHNWDIADRKIYEHAGAMGGARSVVCIFPNQKLTISIMANAQRIWAIEETVHLLALPFLTETAPKTQPKGKAHLELTVNSQGKRTKKKGMLILDNKNDRIIVDAESDNEKIYGLIYLKRENSYALIHPHGLLYTEIYLKNGVLSGKTMYYRSPNVTKPSEALPMFEFDGAFEKLN